jgi:hypothetical protein
MSVEHISKFITDLSLHFAPPKHASPDAEKSWLTTMVTALRGSSPATLSRAKVRMIETRKNRYFPLIAEIREACRHAASEINFDEHVQNLPGLRAATEDYNFDFADELLKTSLGHQACREDWHLMMRDFCRVNRRLPQGPEIADLKRKAKAFDDLREEIYRTGAGIPVPNIKNFVNWAEVIVDKREMIAKKVLGK